jgi:hypothetical protein
MVNTMSKYADIERNKSTIGNVKVDNNISD